MLGTSPFIGSGQFGPRASAYYKQFFQKPENMVKLMVEAVELGIDWIQAIGYDEVGQAVDKARECSGKDIQVAGTIGLRDFDREFELMKDLQAKVIFTHANITDRLDSYLTECIERIGEVAIPGAATHRPGFTIPKLSQWDKIRIVMAPINKTGIYMVPSEETTLQAIEKTEKIVIGKKTLAAGRLKPGEALEYVAGFVYGVVIGIASSRELKETFGIAKGIWNR